MQKYYKYTFKLNALHSMNNAEPHAHTFYIVLFLKDNTDTFTDYDTIESKINSYFNKFTNKVLNNTEEFENIVPSIENMANKFYEDLIKFINELNYELVKLELSDNILKKFTISSDIVIGNCMNVLKMQKEG